MAHSAPNEGISGSLPEENIFAYTFIAAASTPATAS